MAVRGLVKVLKTFFFLTTTTFQNGPKIAVRDFVKVLEKFFLSENEYFPKMALELL